MNAYHVHGESTTRVGGPSHHKRSAGGFETRPYNGTDTLRERAGSGDFEPREYSTPFWRKRM